MDIRICAEYRAELIAKLETLDARLYPALEVFHAAHPELVPCGDLTFQDQRFWRVSGADINGFMFSHQCIDHGYDLHDTETVMVPAGFIVDSTGWGIAYAAELAAVHTDAELAATASRRAQYEALRAEFDQQYAE